MLKGTYRRNQKNCRLQLQQLEDRNLMSAVTDLNSVVEYDRATGTQRIVATSPELDSAIQEMRIAGYGPSINGQSTGRTDVSIPETPPGRSVFGNDDRVQVTPTTGYPWRTLGALYADQYAPRPCSGSLVSPFHFLTAGHCVHAGSGGNWFTGISVAMGQDGQSNRWYGQASWSTMRTYSNWTVSGSADWDFALITLDRPVGNWVGWLGREWWANDSSYNGMTVNTAGYPADKAMATMWWATGATDYATTHRIYYNDTLDTAGGQSGSAVWRYDGTNRYVTAVHAYGDGGDHPGYNAGVRMTQGKYNDVSAWIAADATPASLGDLVDYDKWFSSNFNYFSSSPVKPGDNLFVQPYIQNNGFATGGYWVDFFASTDSTITTSDNLIGYVWVSSTGAYTWVGAAHTNTFPTIPAGNYYVGWVIDTFNQVAEYDESNNTGVITNNVLTVLPAAPSSLAASPISNNRIDLSWSEVAGEYGYAIERSPNGSTGWVQVGTNSANDTTFSDLSVSSGTAYYYRVRAYTSGYGNYSPTSGAVTFVDAPADLNAVGGIQKITLNWSDVNGEYGYEIYRSPTGVGNWTQLGSVSSDTTTYIDTGLPPNTTYYYRVRGYNVSGYGQFSLVSGATTSIFSIVNPLADPLSEPDPIPPIPPPPQPSTGNPFDRELVSPSKPTPATAMRRVLLQSATSVVADAFGDMLP